MSLTNAVTAQFKLILLEKCRGKSEGPSCHDDGEAEFSALCIFHLFTAVLGYVLIVTVALGQIPLLFKILKFQSGKSYFSPITIATLLVTSSNYVAYAVFRNLPISTWGEGIVQLAQNVIIINLMFLHNGRHGNAVAFMLVYVLVMVLLLWPFVPGYLLVALKVANLPISMLTKINWIYRCHKEKGRTHFSTKSSIILMDFCCFGRLLTSVVDAKDFWMFVFYIQECVFNSILTIQTIRYGVKRRRLHRNGNYVEQRTSPSG